ncbi:MAG: hypothetical protein NW207_04780 [Cytophagales bacterium]|nr:hypothetical protein [Cytophagales bacterium]
MAKKKAKLKSKFNYSGAIDMFMAGAGGYLGTQVTTVIEKNGALKDNQSFAPAVTAAIGFALSMFMPQIGKVAEGMTTVAITELLSNIVSTGTAAAATSTKQTQGAYMGYVPRLVPQGENVKTINNTVIK